MNPLLSLLQLADPVLPIGGFSHSAGLETYVQLRLVKDPDTARQFISEMLGQSIHYTDAALVSLSYDAAKLNNLEKLQQLDDECTAVKLPLEIRQASHKLGLRLVRIFGGLHSSEVLTRYLKAIESKVIKGNYSIAFGIIAAISGISKADALTGFYYNAAAGMVTNSVKLIPLGQQDGQKILFAVQPLIRQLVERSLRPDEEMIGLCCTGFDIRCMQHEQLYSRLYMS